MNKNILANTLKRLVYRNSSFQAYYLANLHYYNFIQGLNSRNRKTVIVYQMGKVGSTTVWDSLRALENVDVYHVHALTRHGVKSVENYYKNNFSRTQMIPTHLLESQYLRKQLNKGLQGKNKWKVVTLLRDPIAKNISSFFQKLESFFGYKYKDKIKNVKPEIINKDLIKLFTENFDRHEKPLNWFDSELKLVFDIDVFLSEFPKEQGYKIYETDLADLLIIKLEKLNECACVAFKNLLGINEFAILESNVGGSKSYGDIYQRFLDSIVLPDSYIEQMYTSKYVRHFYSEEEIEAFKTKWLRQNHP